MSSIGQKLTPMGATTTTKTMPFIFYRQHLHNAITVPDFGIRDKFRQYINNLLNLFPETATWYIAVSTACLNNTM